MDESITNDDDLRLLQELDPRTLSAVYDRYSPLLYRYAFRQLGDADLAEECVAETFSRLLKALCSSTGPRDHLKAYLYQIAHNWIVDFFRRKPPMELSDEIPAQSLVEADAIHAIEQRRVRIALQKLSPDQRQVILLRFMEGWSLEETALVLRKPSGAVKSLQHRAIGALRKLLNTVERDDHGKSR